MPESFKIGTFDMQLFDYIITFVNSQHWNTISEGDLYSKTDFKRLF